MASKLHLFGINPIATTLIGVLELDERTILIGIANTAGMDEKTRKAVVQDLKTSLPHPAKFLHGVDPSYLASAFANHAQPTLHTHLQTSMDAVSTVEQTLRKTNCDRILYTCATAKAYLTVASELGLSKSDFFKFAELKTLIPERREETKTVVGSVHQLLEQHKKNSGQMVTWDGFNRLPYDIQKGLVSEYNSALSLIAHAPKYKLKTINPDLQKNVDDFDDNYTEKFFPGDYRLPYDCCVFEYEGVSDTNGDEILPYRHIVLCIQSENYVSCMTFGRVNGSEFYSYFLGGGWKHDEKGRITKLVDNISHKKLNDIVPEDARTSIAVANNAWIMQAVAAINNPQSIITSKLPPNKLQRARSAKGKVPFFDYKEIDFTAPVNLQGEIVRGNAIEGRSSTALHIVRGHARDLANGDQLWIGWHYRGDAKHGVIHKSFTDEKMAGPPAKTLG